MNVSLVDILGYMNKETIFQQSEGKKDPYLTYLSIIFIKLKQTLSFVYIASACIHTLLNIFEQIVIRCTSGITGSHFT